MTSRPRHTARTKLTLRANTADDVTELLDLWLRSVRATHGFLTERDIESLVPAAQTYLKSAVLVVPSLADSKPLGFMGLSGENVDSLFVAPERFRSGVGRALLDYARRQAGKALRVEVNEQNPGAVSFHSANGFTIVGRSELDHDGRPFPLLIMREPSSRISH